MSIRASETGDSFEKGQAVVGVVTYNSGGRPKVYAPNLIVSSVTKTRINTVGPDSTRRAYLRTSLKEVGTTGNGYESQHYVITHRGSDLHIAARKGTRQRKAATVVEAAIKELPGPNRGMTDTAYDRRTPDEKDGYYVARLHALRAAVDEAIERMETDVYILPASQPAAAQGES